MGAPSPATEPLVSVELPPGSGRGEGQLPALYRTETAKAGSAAIDEVSALPAFATLLADGCRRLMRSGAEASCDWVPIPTRPSTWTCQLLHRPTSTQSRSA